MLDDPATLRQLLALLEDPAALRRFLGPPVLIRRPGVARLPLPGTVRAPSADSADCARPCPDGVSRLC